MRRLVADLLLLARADVGRQEQRRLTDLAGHLTDAAAELGPGIEDHEVTIDPKPAPVEGLGDDLHRLILNLLENALSHTPPGTHITASSGMRDGHPVLDRGGRRSRNRPEAAASRLRALRSWRR